MDYRFKTEEEFLDEYGKNWRNIVAESWISPQMDEWFGRKVPFEVDEEFTEQDVVPSNLGGEWYTSLDMMTVKPLPKPLIPDYTPRKILRESEDGLLYGHVVFKVNNQEEADIIQKNLFELGYVWWNDNSKRLHDFTEYPKPFYIIVHGMRKHIATFSSGEIEGYIKRNNELGKSYYPTVLRYTDSKFCDNVLKTGMVGPNYEPRKTKRMLESTGYKYYNEVTKQYTDWPYRFKTKDEFNQTRPTSGMEEWRCGEYLFVSPMSYLFGETLKYDFEDGNSYILIPREYGDGSWYITKEMLMDNSVAKPSYKPRKMDRTMESVENYLPLYVYCDNRNKYIEFEDFLHKNNWTWSGGSKYILRNGSYTEVTFGDFNLKEKVFSGWSVDRSNSPSFKNKKKYTYPEDFSKLRSELSQKPDYKPRKMNRTIESLNENSQYPLSEEMLLEKSSLTRLGVPREVMQPLQRDFAIPADAEWERINMKRDIEKIFRDGEKELILQIETDSIKAFVSYFTPSTDKYFIDGYVMDDSGWGGYEKQPREEVSLTQLLYQINPRSLLYHLKSPFSLVRQPKRKLMKKEKSFQQFTEKFKKDFIENFDSVLKRIVGSRYNDAKQEIRDKARQIEIENKMMLSGLDDPLAGPNSLTILDQFLTEFEDAYSEFFGERLDIQELSEHFSREKVMTNFMYYIYTGRLLDK